MGLLVALGLLAVLQYRWISRASDAERDRLEAGLEASASRFCEAFDSELGRIYRAFQLPEGFRSGDLESELTARLAAWRKEAPVPGLVRELLVVTRPGREAVEIRRLDEASGRLVETSPDPDLA
ncbi:MAG: hypothetical protein L6R30_03855, partial [Thermoanaerobaculia bacterium]|nr:hypothetical protein [Thermoanaerobaculia bacterium]